MPALCLTDIAIARAGRVLLEGISCRVEPGEMLVLRGANGIGKTTLLRTVAGLMPPAAGRIDWGGRDPVYTGHADAIKPTLTVAENLGFWSKIYHQDAAQSAADRLDLLGLTDRYAGTLSAGQKRRLGLARLLISGAEIWAMDEPTVALDTASVQAFEALTHDHLTQGGIIIASTHTEFGRGAKTLDLAQFRVETIDVSADPFAGDWA